ncbi:antigen 5 like allergen Cul n 1-like [Sabethes cyaneus]|uniref:antigen 5 like allergen Cul n 1-like n=1 Tax=Sabethes cyaneus TaxID=53552 RepID=UPI00237E6E86|nr:antigen 5 like allergen Cul n 1-like [Sabethes cyaneus]
MGKTYNLFLLLALVTIPAYSSGGTAPNYCSSTYTKICENKGQHIGCNPKDFSAYGACYNLHPRMIKITNQYKNLILNQHNSLRNTLASGKMSSTYGTFPSAKKMPKLKWNDELAKLAELNVKQCEMEHDRCRSTVKFKNAGQNIYYSSWSVKRTNLEKLIKEGIQAWWDEHKDFYLNEVDKYQGQSYGVLHFTAMAVDYQTDVGCAISMYDYSGTGDTFLMTCNYSSWTWLQKAVYSRGQPCSGCPGKKCDRTYKFLCGS